MHDDGRAHALRVVGHEGPRGVAGAVVGGVVPVLLRVAPEASWSCFMAVKGDMPPEFSYVSRSTLALRLRMASP